WLVLCVFTCSGLLVHEVYVSLHVVCVWRARGFVYVASSTTPTVVTSLVGCPRFSVSQAVSSGLCPGTCAVPSRSVSSDLDTLTPVFELYVRLRERRQAQARVSRGVRHGPVTVWSAVLGEFPTEPVTSEAHPYPHRLLYFLSVLWKYGYKFEMADRRDWGGGGDDPEESTQRMIERIWESLTDIQRRMDQQAPVPPVAMPPGDGETVPIAPVPPGVEVPFVAPVPPPPPVLLAEEPVMQVEKFLRL
ncbi:hypothetical protein Taro_039655, partial [Colocasia esculenta]|nr:hypothetical protein [Colocasia esculenta]